MLRITHAPGHDAVSTLRLEGKLLGPWVAELARSCDQLWLAGFSCDRWHGFGLHPVVRQEGLARIATTRARFWLCGLWLGATHARCSAMLSERHGGSEWSERLELAERRSQVAVPPRPRTCALVLAQLASRRLSRP